MLGNFFDDKTIELPNACIGQGGCWRPGADLMAHAWDGDTLKKLYNRMKSVPSPVFLDIGANTGSVCLMAALIENSRCIAFEPYKPTFDAVSEAVKLNGLSGRVTVENIALVERAKPNVSLFVPSGTNSAETGMARIQDGGDMDCPTKHTVPCMTMDTYFRSHPTEKIDFINIDVEGSELLVLRGGRDTLKRYMPGIQIEWVESHFNSYGYTSEDVIAFLLELGYNVCEFVSVVDRYFYHDKTQPTGILQVP